MRHVNRHVALAAAVCLLLGGCTADGPADGGSADPGASGTAAPPSEASPDKDAESEPSTDVPSSPSDDPSALPEVPAPQTPGERPGTPTPDRSDPAPAPDRPDSPAPTVPPEPSPTPSPTPTVPERIGGPAEVLAFGRTAEWADGLRINVGTPTTFVAVDDEPTAGPTATDNDAAGAEPEGGPEPSARASAGTTGPADVPSAPPPTEPGATAPTSTVLVVELVIANGTHAQVNPSIFVAMTSGGEDAEPVYDPDSGLTGPPGTMLPPGEEVRFSLAFDARDLGDLAVEVRPAYHYDAAVFAGAAG